MGEARCSMVMLPTVRDDPYVCDTPCIDGSNVTVDVLVVAY